MLAADVLSFSASGNEKMTENIRLRASVYLLWLRHHMHVFVELLLHGMRWRRHQTSLTKCSSLFLFFFFLRRSPIRAVKDEKKSYSVTVGRRKEKKNDERRWEKNGDSFKHSTTYGTLAIKKKCDTFKWVEFSALCLRTHCIQYFID